MSRIDSTSNAEAFAALGCRGSVRADDGAGVTIALLDWGFDIFHPALRRPDGTSRFAAIVDQNTGRTLTRDRLEALLRSGAHDRRLADAIYDPHAFYCNDEADAWGTHGTAMASIAAGSRIGPFVGLAPAADLIGVQLAHLDADWQEVDDDGRPSWRSWDPAATPVWDGWRTYADSPAIVDGLESAWRVARARGSGTLVILLALGSWAGPHDGGAAVDRKVADLVRRAAGDPGAPLTAVVAAAGNAAGLAAHAATRLEAGAPAHIQWRVDRRDTRPKKLEVWYRSATPPLVTLRLPAGGGDHDLSPGPTRPLVVDGQRFAVADHRPVVRAPLGAVRISLDPSALPGAAGGDVDATLALRLALPPGAPQARVHAWAERDDRGVAPATLAPAAPTSTLTSVATAPGALVVGLWDHRKGPDASPDPISSQGPHPWRDGPAGHIPHVIAPGHRILAARSKSSGFVPHTGSSPAAALAAGALALAFSRVAAGRADPARRRAAQVAVLGRIAEGRGETWSPGRGHGPIDLQRTLTEET